MNTNTQSTAFEQVVQAERTVQDTLLNLLSESFREGSLEKATVVREYLNERIGALQGLYTTFQSAASTAAATETKVRGRKATVAAGLPRVRKIQRRPVTEPEIAEILRLRNEKLSVRKIADAVGRNLSTVQNVLARQPQAAPEQPVVADEPVAAAAAPVTGRKITRRRGPHAQVAAA